MHFSLVPVTFRYTHRSVRLREEHGLRVFENSVLRKMFGPKKNEVTEEWNTQHNE
jgi:hypothetical protein